MAVETAWDGVPPPGICLNSFRVAKVNRPGFLGTVLKFCDGSSWKLTRAVSDLKHQQGEPPFEARQVYEATCLEDPEGTYAGVREAIVKVKYQIQGSLATLRLIDNYISVDRRKLAQATTTQDRVCLSRLVEYDETLRYMATNAVEKAHQYTLNEIQALRKLAAGQCAHTPHLLDVVGDWQPHGVDDQGMNGGFAIFILMTKVPGEAITYETMREKTVEERDDIRAAFKTALMEVQKLGFALHDCGMRNIMWDKEERKCYIVDFETYTLADVQPERLWDDDWYGEWELLESDIINSAPDVLDDSDGPDESDRDY